MPRTLATRIAVIASIALAVLAVITAPTVLAYPPGQTTIGTNSSVYESGAPVIVTVSGFNACVGKPVTITVTPTGQGSPAVYTMGTVNPDGTYQVTIPAGQAGSYTISATAEGCTTNETTIVVNASEGPPKPGPGPKTGSDTFPMILQGVSLAVLGVGFIVVARRRREPRSS